MATYNKKFKKAGKLVIFNMENFDNTSITNLPGLKDVETLKSTFKLYNSDVEEVHNDLNRDQIFSVINKLQSEDFNDLKYIAVAILTHGDRQGMMITNDRQLINLDMDIILPILKNQSLRNKPKLFIVDACKGKYDLLNASTDANRYVDGNPIPGNTLRCYAATEGFKAYGTLENGSFFTTEFCRLLVDVGKIKSVEDIMKLTIAAVHEKTRGAQTPSYESNMIENFILGDYI